MKNITLEEIEKKLVEVSNMSCKPDKEKFYCYKSNSDLIVIDEEKSVKWNREEVARRNAEYDAEVKRLGVEINRVRHETDLLAKSYIEQETGMNDNQSSICWRYIFREYHAYIGDLISHLAEFTDLYNQIQQAGKKEGA